jgi:UDP-glucose 4-epimerase
MRGDFVPTLLGFDPMYQILSDDEVLESFMLALKSPDARGAYNIRGRTFEPLSQVIRGLGKTPVPLPEFLVHIQGRALWSDNLKFDHNYLKFPFTVDGARAKEELGYDPVK